MKERVLLVIALVWSLIGLFILMLIANYSEPPQLSVSQLEDKVGKIVAVNAEVDSISYKQDTVFLTLKDSTGTIAGVFFGNPKYEIIESDSVAVKGKVQLYKGDLEIVIQELVCLSCQ